MSLGALGTAAAMLPLFAAFEAHVINVTAKIENALAVSTDAIDFGTVFPQEHLEKPLGIWLSDSFMKEDRVDDVEYFIRQKPKCAVTAENGTVMLPNFPTATGHITVVNGQVKIDCGPDPRPLDPTGQPLPTGSTWGVLPSLCPYISKEGEDRNDGDTPSFHQPWQIVNGQIVWLDTPGRLAKSEQDIKDEWVIDLAVPCFGGFCAQDWADFVHGINPNADPKDYTQPIANEHKIFGCDLWVEVTKVSERPTQPPITLTQCNDGVDNTDPEDNAPDEEDPGCHTDGNAANPASYNPSDNDETNLPL